MVRKKNFSAGPSCDLILSPTPSRSDDPAMKRRSMFGTASPSGGHTPSPAGSNTSTTPTDPPREIKLNKMALLKKAVNERRLQQKQQESEGEGTSAESATNGVATLNTNSNNNSRPPPMIVVDMSEDDQPRPKSAPSKGTSGRTGSRSLSDIFVAKSTLPTVKEEGEVRPRTTSGKKLRRQMKSDGNVSVGSKTVTSVNKDVVVSNPFDDDDVI